FIRLLTSLIKYNASCISIEHPFALVKMIKHVCQLAHRSESVAELTLIYDFLFVVISYSHLPSETLSQFVVVLCVGVNRKELYADCCKIMRNLIGTYLGFAALTTLHHL